eukprot:5670292-Amphidinium_carterae.1
MMERERCSKERRMERKSCSRERRMVQERKKRVCDIAHVQLQRLGVTGQQPSVQAAAKYGGGLEFPGNSVNPMDGSIPGPPAIVPKVYQPLPVNERAELFRGQG